MSTTDTKDTNDCDIIDTINHEEEEDIPDVHKDEDAENLEVDPTKLPGLGTAKNLGVDAAKVIGVRMEDNQIGLEEEEAAPAVELEPLGGVKYLGRRRNPAPTHSNLQP